MSRVYAWSIAWLMTVTASAFAGTSDTVSIGEFRYLDASAPNDTVDSQHSFNEMEFEFLLAETLSAMTDIVVVEEHLATFRIVGRVTRVDSSGSARIEIAFVRRAELGQPFDSLNDVIALEATLSDDVDAMLGLVKQTRETVVERIASIDQFDVIETIATR